MKAKYLVIIGLLAATFAACSRDEESFFDKPAAIRAQEAVENAFDVLTSNSDVWEMHISQTWRQVQKVIIWY